ncbi:hypothetical protein [Aliivibrio fischeri]|uniref:hypothetical protein n=1 Tax=Aliivibrio fischeri TaxID=668 RepID=UPI0012D9F626|nr:hypothetical protein [Aliivibrio fischeri]MUJ20434.1 hypothetical protein [Aliivibrio fischeri]
MYKKLLTKFGLTTIKDANEMAKNAASKAREEALIVPPLHVVTTFISQCRKFNLKVVSIESKSDVITANLARCSKHIGEHFCISVTDNAAKEFANRNINGIKIVEDTNLLH